MESQNNEARQLLLWFKGLKENKTRILAEKLKENKSRLLHVERCEMYTAFKERYERGPSKQVSDEEGWTEVVKKPKPARTTGRATTVCEPPRPVTRKQLCAPLLCCLGQNCEDGSNCKYSHSREDNEYFKRRKGKGNRYRKTSMCTQYPRCKSSTIRCDFAHEESDRWCLKCHTQGHFQRDCKNTKCTHHILPQLKCYIIFYQYLQFQFLIIEHLHNMLGIICQGLPLSTYICSTCHKSIHVHVRVCRIVLG